MEKPSTITVPINGKEAGALASSFRQPDAASLVGIGLGFLKEVLSPLGSVGSDGLLTVTSHERAHPNRRTITLDLKGSNSGPGVDPVKKIAATPENTFFIKLDRTPESDFLQKTLDRSMSDIIGLTLGLLKQVQPFVTPRGTLKVIDRNLRPSDTNRDYRLLDGPKSERMTLYAFPFTTPTFLARPGTPRMESPRA